jgi:hypothetical protein
MTEHAQEIRELRRAWTSFTLREKRMKLVEEKLGAVVAEARPLGIGPVELAATLRLLYQEEP